MTTSSTMLWFTAVYTLVIFHLRFIIILTFDCGGSDGRWLPMPYYTVTRRKIVYGMVMLSSCLTIGLWTNGRVNDIGHACHELVWAIWGQHCKRTHSLLHDWVIWRLHWVAGTRQQRASTCPVHRFSYDDLNLDTFLLIRLKQCHFIPTTSMSTDGLSRTV